jgi:peptidoglycan hydrolase-like protein with peptidoglycan-binding domain
MLQLDRKRDSTAALARARGERAQPRAMPRAPLRSAPSAKGCACGGGCPRCRAKLPVQAKLAVVKAGDIHEQEADRMAEQVMRMSAAPPLPNRSAAVVGAPSLPEASLRDIGAGQPLPPAALDFFEPRFGADFGDVRVHTDGRADRSARELGALAYTAGSHIVFAQGQFGPGTASGDRLIAHELTHTIQQSKAGGPRLVQRKIGDGHDLSAPSLAGDEDLEACFDGEKSLKAPTSKGESVRKLQQALLDLGFSLPTFGADGNFGDETKKAVMEFQKSSGLSGADVDGVVGARTMGLLDVAVRHGHVMADTDKQADDFRVTDKYQPSKDEPMTIFFTVGSADIDKEEEEKLTKILGNPAILEVWLEGSASEEGPADFNRALAQKRTHAVAERLSGSNIKIHESPNAEAGVGDVKYRQARSVKVLQSAPSAKKKGCKKGDELEACPDPHKVLVDAVNDAVDQIDKAKPKLPPTTAETKAIFDRLFRTDDSNRDKVAKDVLDILDKMRTHIGKMPDADAHKCASECNPTCQAGSPAFNRDPGPNNPPGVIYTCPSFKDEPQEKRAIIIVHEGHHGTPGIPSLDYAYQHERLIARLDTQTALKNAASFHTLIKLLNNPGSDTIGPEKPDVYGAKLTDPKERDALDRTVAWLEEWLTKSKFGASELYTAIREAREKGSWKDVDNQDKMDFAAPRFGLTVPPAVPSMSDQTAAAAIYDRIKLMNIVFDNPLQFDKTTGEDAWQRGPGPAVTVNAKFFQLSPSRQMTVLLEELVRATPGISPRLEPSYVALIDYIRTRKGIAGPTP